jgi:hypothetical protein
LVGVPNTFELIKGTWDGKRKEIIPPTPLGFSMGRVCRLTVDRNGQHIALLVNDRRVGNIEDNSFEYGQVGFGVFGSGRAVVDDLFVEATPHKKPATDREP